MNAWQALAVVAAAALCSAVSHVAQTVQQRNALRCLERLRSQDDTRDASAEISRVLGSLRGRQRWAPEDRTGG